MSVKDKDYHRFSIEPYLEFGFYQVLHAVTIQFLIIAEDVDMEFMSFGGSKGRPTCWNDTTKISSDWDTICSHLESGQCANLTVESAFNSIATQWNLFCRDSGKVYLITSLQMIGVFLGAPTFGQISDHCGRKKTFFISSTLMALCGGCSGFSPVWQVFAAFRFMIGFFIGGVLTSANVFFVEFLQTDYRSVATSMGGWNIGFIFLPFLAYLLKDWRLLSWVTNAIAILPIFLILFLKESPRWLIQKGRMDEAEQILVDVAKLNRRPMTSNQIFALREGLEAEKRRIEVKRMSFQHLFTDAGLRKHTLVMAFTWFTVSTVNYGIIFNIGNLTGSIFLNGLLFGLLRWLSGMIACILEIKVAKCGRKLIDFVATGVITVVSLAVVALHHVDVSSWYSRGLMLIASVMTSPLWLVVYLLSVELYPTPIRNIANSFGSAFARLGGTLAPQLLYLNEIWGPSTYLLFGLLAFADLLIFRFFLPETKGKLLMESMAETTGREKGNNAISSQSTKMGNENTGFRREGGDGVRDAGGLVVASVL